MTSRTITVSGLALIVAATLFPFDFSFEEHRSLSNRFGLSGFSTTIESRRSDLIIGADAAFGQPFQGQIGEIRLYRNALSPLQLAQDATAASFSFNDGRHGILTFKGTDQYVQVPNSPAVDIAGRSMTIEMLIKLQDSPSDGAIVVKPWHSVTKVVNGMLEYPPYQYGVEFGSLSKSVNFFFTDTHAQQRGPFSVKAPIDVWTNVAFVYDGVVRGYVDGHEQLVAGVASPLRIGDMLNNVLLFSPWGFGLAAMARTRGLPPGMAALFIFLLGATLSLCIEISQCWLPSRDPSLFDVAANSAGSVLGAVLYFAGGFRVFTRSQITAPKRAAVTNAR